MMRLSGHTAGDSKLLPANPLQRTWPGLLFLAIAAISIWLGFTKPDRLSKSNQSSIAHSHRSRIEGASAPSSTLLNDKNITPHNVSVPDLPDEIEQYLEAFEDEQAEELYSAARDHIGPTEVEALILRFPLTNSVDAPNRILSLLSDIPNNEALATAKSILLQDQYKVDDPILLACATSIAKHGREDAIQVMLERLNQVTPDDSGEIPDHAFALINSLSLASAPELEWFIGHASEGKWIATSEASRMAAIKTLHSYPNVHTTSILARLRDHDESPLIRQLAKDILVRLQTRDNE